MKQSALFTRTLKESPKDETSMNAQLLLRAGFIDKVAAGVYTYLPLGLRVLNKVVNIVREEMNAIDGQEVLMPALTPKEVWDATDRWESLDVLFKLRGKDEKDYALGATHEEIVTPLAKKFIFSYKELPTYIYQIQNKFRNEKRAKAGLLRGREFLMKDLYSFHIDQTDLDAYYEKAQAAYVKVYERCGLGDITYMTYASGGAFSKYSHEYQTLTEAGEDLISICDKCRVAINKEIIEDLNHKCPECGSTDLRQEKAVEVGNIFKLGNRFSAAIDFKYKNAEGGEADVVMGCYGIGPSRVMGTIVEVSNDARGIVWPEAVAPFRVHLIGLGKTGSETRVMTDEIYAALSEGGVEVLYDDRELSAGEKFADADLIGCPYRVVVSDKTVKENSVELKKRNSDAVRLIKNEEILEILKRGC